MIAFFIILGLLCLVVAFDSCDQVEAPVRPQTPRRIAGITSMAATTLLASCAAVPVQQQRLVSKPNMVFNDSGAFVYGPKLHAQLEPGSATNGGAVAAGCTACR